MSPEVTMLLTFYKSNKRRRVQAKAKELQAYRDLNEAAAVMKDADGILKAILPLLHKLPGGPEAVQQADAEIAKEEAARQAPEDKGPVKPAAVSEDKGQAKPAAAPEDKGQAKPSAAFDLPGPVIAGVDPMAATSSKRPKS